MVVGLLRKGRGRRLWQELSPQRCLCSPFGFTSQGDVQWSNIRPHFALPPGPVNQNGGPLCSCSHRLRLMDTMVTDACTNNKTLRSCSGGQFVDKDTTKECCKRGHYGGFSCYPHPINSTSISSEPASINSRYALGKTSSKVSVFAASSSANYSSSFINSLPQSRRTCSGFWSWRRREPPSPCTRSRSFFSLRNNKTLNDRTSQLSEDSVIALAASDVSEADANASSPLPESDEDFDFRNFPALTSSHYQNYERPTQLQVKKRVTWQTRSKLFNTDTKLTEECIPRPRGRTYDFGLGDMFSGPPPPLEAGARPQGGFDTNISVDECEAASPSEAPSSSSFFFAAGLSMPSSRNLPWDTPEADNGSETSADNAQRREDSVQKPPEDDFSWDAYDFDATGELSHILEAE